MATLATPLLKPKNRVSVAPGVDTESENPLAPNASVFNTQGIAPSAPTTGASTNAAMQQAAQAQLKEFSFNPKYAQMDQDYQRRAANAALNRDTALAETDTQHKNALAEAGDVKTQAITRLQERLAGNNLYDSGIRVTEEGNVNKDYVKYLGSLDARRLANTENAYRGYSSEIDNINYARQNMYFQQVQEEEQARLAEAQRQAEATRAQEEAARQAQIMQALAAAQAAANARMSAPNYGSPGGYGIGVDIGGGVGDPYDPGTNAQPQAPSVFALPAGWFQTPGANRQMAENYVTSNIDATLGSQPTILNAVVNALSSNPQGMTMDQLTQLIQATRQQEAAKAAQYLIRPGRAF